MCFLPENSTYIAENIRQIYKKILMCIYSGFIFESFKHVQNVFWWYWYVTTSCPLPYGLDLFLDSN